MKADSTGSIPGGDVAKANAVSTALHRLLNGLGSATFHLNTIVVGLDAVQKGHPKPDGLVISWEPKDPEFASRMARKFAVESTIVRVAEELQSYVGDLSVLPRFKTIAEKWHSKTGGAERLEDIASNVVGQDHYLISAGMLLIGWRNQIVHNGKFAFSAHRKSILVKNKAEIFEKYRHFDVDELLEHVQQGKPTLKDASSLTAMTVNLARNIDAKVYSTLAKGDVVAWLELYGLKSLIQKVQAESSPEKLASSIERAFQTHAPKLYPEYLRFFASDGNELKQ